MGVDSDDEIKEELFRDDADEDLAIAGLSTRECSKA